MLGTGPKSYGIDVAVCRRRILDPSPVDGETNGVDDPGYTTCGQVSCRAKPSGLNVKK